MSTPVLYGPEEITITQVGDGSDALIRFSNGSVYDLPGLTAGLRETREWKDMEAAYDGRIMEAEKRDDRLKAFGHCLFERLHEEELKEEWNRIRSDRNRIRRIVIEGGPGFHEIPWELLDDREFKNVRRAAVVRQLKGRRTRLKSQALNEELRILVVTARPGGMSDIGSRRVLQPLLDAAQRLGDLTPRIDVLRSGAFHHLRWRLIQASHNNSPYHVVHFDMHGEVAEGGKKVVLLFESLPRLTETRSSVIDADRRPAQEVADLLRNHDVQIAVLNACHSAYSKHSSETANLALHMAHMGVPAAVGMRHEITDAGAALFVSELYHRLAEGSSQPHPLTMAVLAAREKMRESYQLGHLPFDESSIPALFVRNTPLVKVDPPDSNRRLRELERNVREVQRRQELAHMAGSGVIGRDLDERVIRSYLFGKSPGQQPDDEEQGHQVRVIRVNGLPGIGKTVLLRDLIRHWDHINYVDHTVWVDAAALQSQFRSLEGARTPEEVTAKVLWDALDGAGLPTDQRTGGQIVTRELVTTRLSRGLDQATETLFVIDNIDRLTHKDLRTEVERYIGMMSRGDGWVILGERSPVDWFRTIVADFDTFSMRGLDRRSAHRLLRQTASATRIDANPVAASQVYSLTAGHPGLISEIGHLAAGPGSSLGDVVRGFIEGTDLALLPPLDAGHAAWPFLVGLAAFTEAPSIMTCAGLRTFLEATALCTDEERGEGVDRTLSELEKVGLLRRVECHRPEDRQAKPDRKNFDCMDIHPSLPYFGRTYLRRQLSPSRAEEHDKKILCKLTNTFRNFQQERWSREYWDLPADVTTQVFALQEELV